ncbi:hypothetical protein [Alkalihalobacterium elongatum]|nr:hypothetical protein [Alkalihalobacterium elongatum]
MSSLRSFFQRVKPFFEYKRKEEKERFNEEWEKKTKGYDTFK